MEILLNACLGLLGTVLLYFGAGWLVHGGAAVAQRLKVPPLVIGLTLVAFGTSAPELVVSVDAALTGHGDVCVGNVVGSNIANTALILGICAVITPLPVNAKLFRLDLPLLVIASAVLAGFLYFSGGLTRWQGGLFLLGLAGYTLKSLWGVRAGGSPAVEESMPLWRAGIMAAGGLGALVCGGKLLVLAAVYLAVVCKIPEAIIGLTVVAVGTSLPELATSAVAAKRGERDIAVGNVIGSNIFNILGILGISPLLAPVSAPGISLTDMALMLFLTLALVPIMKTGHVISRKEGGFLLAVYIAYTCWLIIA